MNDLPERIAQNTLLLAVARVAMTLSLPLLLMGSGYLAAMGSTVNAHTTDIALLQQSMLAAQNRLDAYDRQADIIRNILSDLATDTATTKTDVGYLRSWVEELKRRERAP
jgi:hypothetical protein